MVLDGSTELTYTHFSLALSRSRRLARWVAWNVDGANRDFADEISRDGVDFRPDPRIDANYQTLDEVYAANNLDRGHLARRSDLLWGPLAETEQANEDSFYFTNIIPQLAGFNQSGAAGLWGLLEDALLDLAVTDRLRVSVHAGPVLSADDLPYRGTLVPREFYKVLAYVMDGSLRVRAFLLTQDLDDVQGVTLEEFDVYQVTVDDLTARTSLRFADTLVAARTSTARTYAAWPHHCVWPARMTSCGETPSSSPCWTGRISSCGSEHSRRLGRHGSRGPTASTQSSLRYLARTDQLPLLNSRN